MKRVIHVIPEEQFVAENFFVAVKNRLPGHVTQLDALRVLVGASGRSRRILHTPLIGRIGRNLQRRTENEPCPQMGTT